MSEPEVNIDPTPFASTARTEFSFQELTQAINKAIAQSFREERLRGDRPVVHNPEVKRRSEICLKWFKIMRGDMGYSVERTLDMLPLALRKDIDGEHFEPVSVKDRSAWSPPKSTP